MNYWDEFINRYNDDMPYRPLSVILEAFYYFSNNQVHKSDELMCK